MVVVVVVVVMVGETTLSTELLAVLLPLEGAVERRRRRFGRPRMIRVRKVSVWRQVAIQSEVENHGGQDDQEIYQNGELLDRASAKDKRKLDVRHP